MSSHRFRVFLTQFQSSTTVISASPSTSSITTPIALPSRPVRNLFSSSSSSGPSTALPSRTARGSSSADDRQSPVQVCVRDFLLCLRTTLISLRDRRGMRRDGCQSIVRDLRCQTCPGVPCVSNGVHDFVTFPSRNFFVVICQFVYSFTASSGSVPFSDIA